MKRDVTGKFVHNWQSETKQRVSISLTQTAWQCLEQEAQKRGISRSEVIEHFARSLSSTAEPEQLLQALETERTRFEAVLRQMPAGVLTADAASGALVLANEQAKQIIGYDYDFDRIQAIEVAVIPFTAFAPTGQPYAPEDYPLSRSLRRGEVITNEEMELHRHDGSRVFITVNSAPILDAQENIVAAVAVFQDISDRKHLEAELQRRERQFQTLTENAPDIIARFDRELRHVYVSPAIEQATGLPASQYSGKTHVEVGVPADLCQLWQEQMQACFLTGEGCRFDFEFMTAEGMRYYQTQMVTELAADGAVESLLGITRDVTDYKQVEQALRRSEELYRSLVASLPQLVCIADAEGLTYYCNQTWTDFTGLALEQTQGNGWQQVFHPQDIPIVFRRWVQALRHGESYALECRIRRSDGVYRWHLSRITPIRASGDRIIAWLGTATDIDEQKRTEQTQRFLAQASCTFAAANLNLHVLLDTITHLVSEFTQDVCVLSLLSADRQWFTHASCYHPEAPVQQLVRQLLEAHPRKADEGMSGQVLQTGEPLLLSRAADATRFRAMVRPAYQGYLEQFSVCSVLVVPLTVQGETIGTLSLTRHDPAEPHQPRDISLFQDLADRAAMAIANARLYQQAEQARHRAEQTADRNARLQLVTAALSESLTPAQVAAVVVEQSQAVLQAMAAVVAVVTTDPTELEVIHSVGYPPALMEQWQRFAVTTPVALAETVRTKTPIWEESLTERSQRYPHMQQLYARTNYAGWISLPLIVEGRAIGGMSLSFAQVPTLTEDDRAFMLALAQQCAQAIGRAQLYEAEQRARAEAEAANRMKDEFLAVLSHELRTPMNPILGWAKLLQSGRLTPEKTVIAVETIERNAKLQVQLIEDLLDISRILRGKISLNSYPVDLAVTIRAAIDTVRLAAEAKAIQIHTQFQPQVGCVLGDATRLQQVFWNLLTNAVKFTSTQGRIDIALEQVDDLVQIQIQDTGQGIQPEFLPYVFDTFRQADSSMTRSFGGLGLGLSIVRYIVELHGGSVEAASPGEAQGSTFTVRLPLINRIEMVNQNPIDSALPIHSIPHPGLPTPLAGLNILVVDDEVDNLELVQFILEQAGATVISVTAAVAALEQLRQNQLDVLLADIGMPEMDGYALLRHLRTLPPEQGGRIPAIALTAYTAERDRQTALEVGFQTHLAKPVDPHIIIKTIKDVLRQD
ncbi:PAS domain S-box protein [Pantanalinema rosaneae CENA516]|uniref:PAS domain S-box protein n=1 Tax=Pantanalinema rosaneae TaxID=1620701 RepID=UPI003D6EF0A6